MHRLANDAVLSLEHRIDASRFPCASPSGQAEGSADIGADILPNYMGIIINIINHEIRIPSLTNQYDSWFMSAKGLVKPLLTWRFLSDDLSVLKVRFSPDGRFLVATGANQMSDELSVCGVSVIFFVLLGGSWYHR